MPKYVKPPRFDPDDLKGLIDPYGGFLYLTLHWRPDPKATDPEMPGEKLSMSSYIPVFSGEPCLCGSGQSYGECCQPKRLWHPVCPNPGGPNKGYSLVKPQKARFRNVDGDAIRERLMADRRLHCTDASQASAFWTFLGDPPVEEEYGILCFGDIELKRNHILLVSTMSDPQMQTLLALLQEIAGDLLSEPRITYDAVPAINKETGKTQEQRPSRSQTSRRRKKRKRRR